jgi:trimeric autotransporter adhesin
MLQLCGIQRKAATLSLVLLSACGGGDGDGGTPPSTTTIAKATASGDAQTATVGQALAAPLQVVVTDNGAASAGATVNWATTSGGSLSPTSSTTDANGIAATSWTLGTASGSQQATATLSGATGSPVTFTATASPDQATTLSSAGGDGQSGVINTPLPLQVQAKVADQFGNGIPGVTVDWSATGATVSAPSVPTNASGISAVSVTLGPNEGDVIVTATSGTLSGSPLTFTETATLAPPIPTTASVRVGSGIVFTSNRNATFNPAVDTVAVGGTVTWSWAGALHSVQSTGSPSFTSSAEQSSGSYQFTFNTAGTYSYTCSVHPGLMTGRIVVRTP